MQRTEAGGSFRVFEISARSGNTPCECVQTVSLSSLNSATAAEGPIEACAMYGLV